MNCGDVFLGILNYKHTKFGNFEHVPVMICMVKTWILQ